MSRQVSSRLNQSTLELQQFVDGLRDCLGLAPLYGPDLSDGRVQSHADPLQRSRMPDSWFTPIAHGTTDRDELRGEKIRVAARRKRGELV